MQSLLCGDPQLTAAVPSGHSIWQPPYPTYAFLRERAVCTITYIKAFFYDIHTFFSLV